MKLIKQASGKTTIKMSRSEWMEYGVKAGWMKQAGTPCPKCDCSDTDVKNNKGKCCCGYEWDVEDDVKEAKKKDDPCWKGYEQVGMKEKDGKEVPNCVPKKKKKKSSEDEELNLIRQAAHFDGLRVEAAEYQGKKVELNKPMRGDVKKYKVYVKNDKGNVVKVNFGDKNMEIKRDDPERRKNFRARHNCSNPGPKWKARYWSCKMWSSKSVSDILKGSSYKNPFSTEVYLPGFSKESQSAYDRWKTTPDDYYDSDGPECPECDGPMREKSSDFWVCADDNCDGYIDNEPDYEPDYDDEGGYFGPYGPE
jgi:hypothetical protein